MVEPSLESSSASASEGEGQQGEESVMELGPSVTRVVSQNEVSLVTNHKFSHESNLFALSPSPHSLSLRLS